MGGVTRGPCALCEGQTGKTGLRGEAADEVREADDGDAVVLHDLARDAQVAVAARLGGQVDDDGALAHGLHLPGGVGGDIALALSLSLSTLFDGTLARRGLISPWPLG